MRVFLDGAGFVVVSVTGHDVSTFARTWPCSGLSERPVTFTFDPRNGDLVDSNDATNHPSADGSAILALAEDAQRFAWTKLGLKDARLTV